MPSTSSRVDRPKCSKVSHIKIYRPEHIKSSHSNMFNFQKSVYDDASQPVQLISFFISRFSEGGLRADQ